MSKAAFDAILNNRLIPEFCDEASRTLTPAAFKEISNRVTERDATDFLRAFESGLTRHLGCGRYLFGTGRVKEQFFSQGLRSDNPRTFTLWIEPIITLAAMGRLHWEYRWPLPLIGSQSADWAFDFVAAEDGREDLAIAGEVKKTCREVDVMLERMMAYGADPGIPEAPKGDKGRNAYKKIAALRKVKTDIFWAVGPAAYYRIFRVIYGANGALDFVPVDESALVFRDAAVVSPLAG